MLPYWILFSAFAFAALNNREAPTTNPSRPSLLLFLAGLSLAIMIGLRHETGGDWYNYVEWFEVTTYMKLSTALGYGDPGYMFMNWFGTQVGAGFWFVTFVSAAIFSWGMLTFAKQQPNPWLAIAVAVPYLIIVVAMGYMRQAVAIGIMMAALAAFSQGRMRRFLVLAAIAALFHKSAVLVLPLVALAAVRYRFIINLAVFGIALILFTFLIEAFLSQLMVTYIETEMESDGANVRIAMNVLPAVIFLFAQRRFSTSEAERKLWRNFSLAALALLAGLLTLPSSTVIDRLALYVIPLQIVVLSRLPYAFPQQGRPNVQLSLAVIIYSAVVQFVWLTQAKHAENWLPYRFVFGGSG